MENTMADKFEKSLKEELVIKYLKGESASKLYTKHKIPKSTFYHWVNQYRNLSDVDLDKRSKNSQQKKKLENIIKILQAVDCTVHSSTQVKLAEMEKLHEAFSVHALCEALKVPRGTYYNHILRNKKSNKSQLKRREMLKPLINQIFEESNQIYGAKKIRAVLIDQGHQVSPGLITELMIEMGLESISKNAKREHLKQIRFEKKHNLLNNNFVADAPNKIWCSDFTSFRLKEKRLHLCAIIDLYSRKVVAINIATNATTNLLTRTFKKAISERNPDCSKLMFHSDQGAPFTSYAFRGLLKSLEVSQSFSNPGNPYNNSVIEAFFSHFKREMVYRRIFKSEKELQQSVSDYILFFNEKRPHKSIGYKTPSKLEENFHKLQKLD